MHSVSPEKRVVARLTPRPVDGTITSGHQSALPPQVGHGLGRSWLGQPPSSGGTVGTRRGLVAAAGDGFWGYSHVSMRTSRDEGSGNFRGFGSALVHLAEELKEAVSSTDEGRAPEAPFTAYLASFSRLHAVPPVPGLLHARIGDLALLRDRARFLDAYARDLVIEACSLSIRAAEYESVADAAGPKEGTRSGMYRTQAMIFVKAAIDAAGAAAVGIVPSDIAEIEGLLRSMVPGMPGATLPATQPEEAYRVPWLQSAPDPAPVQESLQLRSIHARAAVLDGRELASRLASWDGRADAVSWDMSGSDAIPENVFDGIAAVTERAAALGMLAPPQVVYGPLLSMSEGRRVVCSGALWLREELPRTKLVGFGSVAGAVAAWLDQGMSGWSALSQQQEAPNPEQPLMDEWDPAAEVPGSSEVFEELVQRSKPLRHRLATEPGWPSEP